MGPVSSTVALAISCSVFATQQFVEGQDVIVDPCAADGPNPGCFPEGPCPFGSFSSSKFGGGASNGQGVGTANCICARHLGFQTDSQQRGVVVNATGDGFDNYCVGIPCPVNSDGDDSPLALIESGLVSAFDHWTRSNDSWVEGVFDEIIQTGCTCKPGYRGIVTLTDISLAPHTGGGLGPKCSGGRLNSEFPACWFSTTCSAVECPPNSIRDTRYFVPAVEEYIDEDTGEEFEAIDSIAKSATAGLCTCDDSTDDPFGRLLTYPLRDVAIVDENNTMGYHPTLTYGWHGNLVATRQGPHYYSGQCSPNICSCATGWPLSVATDPRCSTHLAEECIMLVNNQQFCPTAEVARLTFAEIRLAEADTVIAKAQFALDEVWLFDGTEQAGLEGAVKSKRNWQTTLKSLFQTNNATLAAGASIWRITDYWEMRKVMPCVEKAFVCDVQENWDLQELQDTCDAPNTHECNEAANNLAIMKNEMMRKKKDATYQYSMYFPTFFPAIGDCSEDVQGQVDIVYEACENDRAWTCIRPLVKLMVESELCCSSSGLNRPLLWLIMLPLLAAKLLHV